jgi:hypothetical protein
VRPGWLHDGKQHLEAGLTDLARRGGFVYKARLGSSWIRPLPAVMACTTCRAGRRRYSGEELMGTSSHRRRWSQARAGWVMIAVVASAIGPRSAAAARAENRADIPNRAGTAVSPIGVQVADLQEQLENGLQARLPAEFAFIARVVMKVQQNQLPLELVKGTFQWSRGKKPYPFPYFERALRLRAARLGIALD